MIQRRLREKVIVEPLRQPVQCVAGADVAYEVPRRRTRGFAAVVASTVDVVRTLEQSTVEGSVEFPYVPGLLTFREAPLLLQAFSKLTVEPDVVLVDGHGVAHPRGFGLASFIGVMLDKPTIGCAKKKLVGEHSAVGVRQGDREPLIYEERQVGAVLRTRDGVRPVFVSVGHRIDLEGAVSVVLRCLGRHRIPEPIRQAHLLAGRMRAESLGQNSSTGAVPPSRR